MLEEWTQPPPMSPVAPAPAVLSSDSTLWLAYRIARDPHHCAVIRFHHVQQYAWAHRPPSMAWRAWARSRKAASTRSRWRAGRRSGGRRWLITFPDAMLEVRAADAEVVLRAAAALGPAHALAALLS